MGRAAMADKPALPLGRRVTIFGGGFSGVCVATQLTHTTAGRSAAAVGLTANTSFRRWALGFQLPAGSLRLNTDTAAFEITAR